MDKKTTEEFKRQAKDWLGLLEETHGWRTPNVDEMQPQAKAYVFEIGNDSPRGQDVLQSLWINEADFERALGEHGDLAFFRVANKALREAAEDYDPSEEATLWIDESGHGKNGAPHDLEDLLEDMKSVKSLLEESAADMLRIEDAGGRLPEIPEAAKGTMNIAPDRGGELRLTALFGEGSRASFYEEYMPDKALEAALGGTMVNMKDFLGRMKNHLVATWRADGKLGEKYVGAEYGRVKNAEMFKKIAESYGREGVTVPMNGKYTDRQLEKAKEMFEPFLKNKDTMEASMTDKNTQAKVGKEFISTLKKIRAEREAGGKALSYTMLSKLAAKEVLESGEKKKPALEAYLVSLGIDKVVKDTLEEKIEKAVTADLHKPLSTATKGMTAEQKKIHRMMDTLFNKSSYDSPLDYVKHSVVQAGRSELELRPRMTAQQYWTRAVDHAVNSGGELWHSTYDNESILKENGIKFPKDGADRKYAECMKTYLSDIGALEKKTFERERDKVVGKSMSD